MVKRGPCERPQASEGEAQHGPFCWTGRFGQGDERLHCGRHGQDRAGIEAAQILLVRSTKWSWLKAWAMKIARHRGMKKAIVALARRLAVIMHRIWVDGTEFRWTREVTAA